VNCAGCGEPVTPGTQCQSCGYINPGRIQRLAVGSDLLAPGQVVVCDTSDVYPGTDHTIGIVLYKDDDGIRVILALPGEYGHVAAVTLPADKIEG
jgi:hypothetical protein